MKRTKQARQQLIGWLGLLCAVAFLSSCSAKTSEAQRQQNSVVGTWQNVGSSETIEFSKEGTVTYVLDSGTLEGTYEVVGANDAQSADQMVGAGDIKVDFHGVGPLALPATGKISSSGDVLVLTLSNGRTGEFKKVR